MAGIFNRAIFNKAIFNTDPVPSGGYAGNVFVDFGTLAERRAEVVVKELAEKQALDLSLDERDRQRQLDLELRIAGIEWDTAYLERLNALREKLIEEEIRKRLLALQDEQNAALMLMMASQF